MASVTHSISVICDDAEEYATAIARLDAYQANPQNAALLSREDNAGSRTVSYTVSATARVT